MNQASLIREVIQDIAVGPDRGRDISADKAEQLMTAILNNEVDEVQVAVILIALRMKRESMDEFIGLFRSLQGSIQQIASPLEHLICLADPFDGYVRHLTMTPFIPAVLASLDCPTLMHGVESVGPKHGITASKVYQLAGINTTKPIQQVADDLIEHGWGYLDQSVYAPSLFRLQDLRDRIVKRSALTTLERLLMPIRAKQTHLVLGYVHKAYPEIYGTIAERAGYDTSLLIKGVEGGLAPALNKPLRRYLLTKGLKQGQFSEEIKEVISTQQHFDSTAAAHLNENENIDSAVSECLQLGLDVLSGKKGVARDSLCFAAAQFLYAHQTNNSLTAAVEKVENSLDNGSALKFFNSAK